MNASSSKPDTGCAWGRKNLFAFFSLSVVILIIYSNSFDASWQFDDIPNIVKNPYVHLTELNWPEIKESFYARNGKLFRPAANFSFALNYYFGRLDVFGYHIVNTAIHLVSAIFLFLFIRYALHLPSLHGRYKSKSYAIALLAAVLWAINPVQTQGVTYIVQRMAAMAAMFYIISMYFYLRARTAQRAGVKALAYIACATAGLTAFASKENAVMLPVCLLLIEILLVQGVSFGEWFRSNLKTSLTLLVLILVGVTIYLIAVRQGWLPSLLRGYGIRPFGPIERLLTQPRVILFYITLLLYPVPTRLCIEHDILTSQSLFNPPSTFLAILLLLVVLGAGFFISGKRPLMAFCILFFFLNHLVESSFLPLELVFEHRNYLPSMFFFVPISAGLIWAIQELPTKRSIQGLIMIFTVLLVVGQGHAAYMRNHIWKNGESLWLDCIEKYPQLWRPYINLGKYFSDAGQRREAVEQFRLGLGKRTPNHLAREFYHRTYFNMAGEYMRLGNQEKALGYYLEADSYFSKNPELHVMMAAIYLEQKRFQEAEGRLQEALKYKRFNLNALVNLGALLTLTGRPGKATGVLEKALKISPDHYRATTVLTRALMETGNDKKALFYAKKAVALKPRNHATYLLLAQIYQENHAAEKAQEVMEKALARIDPEQVRPFVEKLKDPERLDVLFPNKEKALAMLAAACRKKSRRFADLADFCLRN